MAAGAVAVELERDLARLIIGRRPVLRFVHVVIRGGLLLRSPARNFGGLSAIRVAADGADLFITTPHYSSHNSWIDPTHKLHLAAASFEYFTGNNFGAGSSREAAVYALYDYGVRCVIVDSAIKDHNVMAWDFVMGFAKDNRLKLKAQ